MCRVATAAFLCHWKRFLIGLFTAKASIEKKYTDDVRETKVGSWEGGREGEQSIVEIHSES